MRILDWILYGLGCIVSIFGIVVMIYSILLLNAISFSLFKFLLSFVSLVVLVYTFGTLMKVIIYDIRNQIK